MKPDWKDAPPWAKYLVMNHDGSWCGFEDLPFCSTTGWFSYTGRSQSSNYALKHWQKGLSERPIKYCN